MRALSTKLNPVIRQIAEQIITSGQMTRQDYQKLTSTLLSEQRLSDEDRCQINRIFDYVQAGRLRLVD